MGFLSRALSAISLSDGGPPTSNALFGGGRSYDAGRYDSRETQEWHPSVLTPDEEILGNKEKITARARDLDRNDGYVSGGLDRKAEAVVGAKIRLEARPAYEVMGRNDDWADELANMIEAQFRVWSHDPFMRCDAEMTQQFGGLVKTAYLTYATEGEAAGFIMDLERGGPFSTAVKMIDPDRISNPNNLPDNTILKNGNRLVGGVEVKAKTGAPVAYHVRKAHPSDTAATMDKFTWLRIPRTGKTGRPRFVHAFSKRRAEQRRGISQLAAIMVPTKMLQRADRATVEAQLLQTIMSVFIESSATNDELRDALAPAGDPSSDPNYAENLVRYRQDKKIKLRGAQVVHGVPGEKAIFNRPSIDHEQYKSFEENVLRRVASKFGLSYPQLAQNWADINYSSARAMLNEIWRSFLDDRHVFTQAFCTPIYAAWLEEAVARGRIPLPASTKTARRNFFYRWRTELSMAEWMGPGRGTVDPLKEEKAASEANAAGRVSQQSQAAEQGRDHQEEMNRQRREMKKRKEYGLPEPSYGSSTANSPNAGGEDDENSDAADMADQREQAGEDA